MINREQGILWAAHPRTKSSAMYPDVYKDKDFFLSDRFIGASWESLPVDQSQKRLCEVRCFGVNDDMSNWAPKPKFMLAEGDTYMKVPSDETYPLLAINYLKLDKVPAYNESWAPVVEGIRAGNFFGTTGEILFHEWGIEGGGRKERLHGEHRIHFPAGIRRAGVERRHEGRPQDHQSHRYRAVRDQKLPDSLRRDGQEVGAVRRVGLGRRRGVAAAGRNRSSRGSHRCGSGRRDKSLPINHSRAKSSISMCRAAVLSPWSFGKSGSETSQARAIFFRCEKDGGIGAARGVEEPVEIARCVAMMVRKGDARGEMQTAAFASRKKLLGACDAAKSDHRAVDGRYFHFAVKTPDGALPAPGLHGRFDFGIVRGNGEA